MMFRRLRASLSTLLAFVCAFLASPELLGADLDDAARRVEQAAGSIAVIYPDMAEPYRTVFSQIADGILETAQGARVFAYPVGTDRTEINAAIKRSGARVVIALGRQGIQMASGLDHNISVIAGAIASIPENNTRIHTAISLSPDPAFLFTRLRTFVPSARRIHIVYSPQNTGWLVKAAREAAKTQGLELFTYEARDLATAVRHYDAIFAQADSRRDAIWLPQDPLALDEANIVPMVLKEAWNKSIGVFSGSLVHVRRGVLFSLYPNNARLGNSLATSALSYLAGDVRGKGLVPLRDVNTAVNSRTANHLGSTINYQINRNVDYVFPEQ